MYFVLNFWGRPIRNENDEILYFESYGEAETFCLVLLRELLSICATAQTDCFEICHNEGTSHAD